MRNVIAMYEIIVLCKCDDFYELERVEQQLEAARGAEDKANAQKLQALIFFTFFTGNLIVIENVMRQSFF